jgi:hypothetical protein
MERYDRRLVPRRTSKTAVWRAIARRFDAFALETHPEAAGQLARAFTTTLSGAMRSKARLPQAIEGMRAPLIKALARNGAKPPKGALDPTPGVSPAERVQRAAAAISGDVSGFLEREAIRASFDARRALEILRGMILTRATDNRLSFSSRRARCVRGGSFQGRGFRSLGQEAIYAARDPLRRGASYRRGRRVARGTSSPR